MTQKDKQEMQQKREYARIMYVHGNLNQIAIAVELNVSEQTISEWKKDGKWERLKTGKTISDQEIVAQLEELLQLLIDQGKKYLEDDDPKTNPDADRIIKTTKAIAYLKKKAGPAQMYQTGIAFITWLGKENSEIARQVAPLFQAFIRSLV
ncbi:hypothetical protein CJD36_019910 [Flavipsychrobacter stenotrophus]|uniref:DDE transposase family protein n=1 Tax=Flavipsychrobacter stenotrophus TaxID=2077091 RepID=A0A2S7SSC4_9BACT|nr:DUF1804 family protein [Flavipsychrobacter stenotrophus]PQJ09507.1 hypothetical protein CJD36_019910 [Flavipsychrobacter stenotrophus]